MIPSSPSEPVLSRKEVNTVQQDIHICPDKRIVFYGNVAGYVNGGEAVVDRLFQRDELSLFLAGQGLVPRWEEGIYAALSQTSGIPMEGRAAPAAGPFQPIRIWQMGIDTDPLIRFLDYEARVAKYGLPKSEEYHCVFDGPLGTEDLEEIYEKLNDGPKPEGYSGYSLSVSDIVELYDAQGSRFYYVDSLGFQSVPFQPQQVRAPVEPALSRDVGHF